MDETLSPRQQLTKWHHLLENVEYVYFVGTETGEPVKIGYSRNPLKRLANLRNASPEDLKLLAVAPGGRRTEAWLHRKFRENRLRGEWFQGHLVDEMVELLAYSGPEAIDRFRYRWRPPLPVKSDTIKPRATAVPDHAHDDYMLREKLRDVAA